MLGDFLFVPSRLDCQLIDQLILLANILAQVPEFDEDHLQLEAARKLFQLLGVVAEAPFHHFVIEALPV